MKFVKVVVLVPKPYAAKVRRAMTKAGAGCWPGGKYDQVSGEYQAIGRFRPLTKAQPAIGQRGREVEVREKRIEMLCECKLFPKVIESIKKAHPYEEPAIEVYPLLYP